MVAVGYSRVSPALSLEVLGKSRPEFCEHQAPDFHCFFFFSSSAHRASGMRGLVPGSCHCPLLGGALH